MNVHSKTTHKVASQMDLRSKKKAGEENTNKRADPVIQVIDNFFSVLNNVAWTLNMDLDHLIMIIVVYKLDLKCSQLLSVRFIKGEFKFVSERVYTILYQTEYNILFFTFLNTLPKFRSSHSKFSKPSLKKQYSRKPNLFRLWDFRFFIAVIKHRIVFGFKHFRARADITSLLCSDSITY